MMQSADFLVLLFLVVLVTSMFAPDPVRAVMGALKSCWDWCRGRR